MSIIKISHVISFSSEDSVYAAHNVLADTCKSWKCRSSGEKSAFIVLQLEKAYKITSLDIGNEHSAFVEVLVGRSGANEQKFEVLLVTSSFMTPMESRHSTTLNRVRMFSSTDFSAETRDQKWDRVKLVCTQPFNSHVQYGLSFVKLRGAVSLETRTQTGLLIPKDVRDSPQLVRRIHISKETRDSSGNNSIDKAQSQMVGRFKMREDSPENDILPAGSLFARRKELTPQNSSTTAAAIKDASMQQFKFSANVGTPKTKPTPKTTAVVHGSDRENDKSLRRDRNRVAILYTDEDDQPNERLDKLIQKNLKATDKLKQKEEEPETFTKNVYSIEKPAAIGSKYAGFVVSASTSSHTKHNLDESLTKLSNNTASTSVKTPNNGDKRTPKRGGIDTVESAIKKTRLSVTKVKQYKPFHQLLEGVTIVISGFQNPLRSNIRQMAISMGASYKPDWCSNCTHLICAIAHTPKYQQVQNSSGKIVKKDWIEKCHALSARLPWRRFALNPPDVKLPESEDEILDEFSKPSTSSTAKMLYDNDNDTDNVGSDRSNTEDEIDKLVNNNKMDTKVNSTSETINPFEVDTEPDELTKFEQSKEKLEKRFFRYKTFYVDADDLGAVAAIKLRQFIKLFKGKLSNEVSENVDYYITSSRNKKINKQQAEMEFVKPEWIYECNDMEMLLTTDKYTV